MEPVATFAGGHMLPRLLCASIFAIFGSVDAAAAQPVRDATRGELLYSTHCISCHTAEVHWRKSKAAIDWTTLEAQVRRWQDNTGLGWSNAEVREVARYLNTLHYRYPAPD